MAVLIDWVTKVITIEQVNLTNISGSSYSYTVDQFADDLKDRFDDEDALVFIVGYNHIGPITLGSITLARIVEIINGYTIEFEDLVYSVEIQAGNTNIFDVLVANQVSVFGANSAGLISSAEITLIRKLLDNRKELSDGTTGNLVIYDDDDATVLRTYDVVDESNATIALGAGDPAKQSKGV